LILRDRVHDKLREADPDARDVEKPEHAHEGHMATLWSPQILAGGSKHETKDRMKKKEGKKDKGQMG